MTLLAAHMSHSGSGEAEEVGTVSRAGQGAGLQPLQFTAAGALKELPLIFTKSSSPLPLHISWRKKLKDPLQLKVLERTQHRSCCPEQELCASSAAVTQNLPDDLCACWAYFYHLNMCIYMKYYVYYYT